MCSRRRKAPSVPASLQRSASASNRRFSLPENWRRLAIATTSGSRRAPSPEAISPVALPAPSATASEEEPDNPFREDFTNEVMFMSTCTLNCPRQVSHLTLARGGRAPTDEETWSRQGRLVGSRLALEGRSLSIWSRHKASLRGLRGGTRRFLAGTLASGARH